MNLEELLGTELASQVTAKLGDKKLMLDDGKMIPKTRFDEVNTQKNELKEQVNALNGKLTENAKDLETLKQSAGVSEELKKQVQTYQDKMKATQKEFGETLTTKEKEWKERDVNNRKAFTLREKLLMEHADPKYIDLLMKNVDLKTISESEDGKLLGVDDVVKDVKTNFDKLFGKPKTTGTGFENGSTGSSEENLKALAKQVAETGGSMEARLAYAKAKQGISKEEE